MKCKTVGALLDEYTDLYGKDAWALSTYSSNMGLINNYIKPLIGETKLSELSTRFIEKYYQTLLHTPSVENPFSGRSRNEYVTAATVRNIHKLLRNCFEQAIKWELLEKNPSPRLHDADGKGTVSVPEGVDAEALAKVLANPEMAALLERIDGGMFLCYFFNCQMNNIRISLRELPMSDLKKQINYAIICVNEFARRYNLSAKQAFQYLYQNKAIDFIKEYYDIEHTLSISDAVEDMAAVCRNNGGMHL